MKEKTIIFKNVCKEKALPLDENMKIIYIFRDTSNLNDKYWSIHEILYIGKSIDANGRLNSNHEKIPLAKHRLKEGHFLTFAYCVFNGNVSDETIREIENALIYKVKPILNIENKDNYNYGPIRIDVSGVRSTLLPKTIIINNATEQ